MTTMSLSMLHLDIDSQRHEIALDHASAPATIEQLLRLLPLRVDLHVAKVAGDQILLPVPLDMPFEAARDILQSPPGTVIYYAKRQFLEILLGPLSERSAEATVLGQVQGDLGRLNSLCLNLQRTHGRTIVWSDLRSANQTAAAPDPAKVGTDDDPTLARAVHVRRSVWSDMPADLLALKERRGPIIPIGPIFYVESELRKLHEYLWSLRETGDEALVRGASAVLLKSAANQLIEFFGLEQSGGILLELGDVASNPGPLQRRYSEIVLTVGRLSHWVDLLIPWNDLNIELTRHLS